jgi:hypothetical protein
MAIGKCTEVELSVTVFALAIDLTFVINRILIILIIISVTDHGPTFDSYFIA